MRRRLLCGCVALGLLQVACGAVGDQMTADVDDYDAYRRTRTASRFEDRLRASSSYLESHPRGRWRPEVSTWFRTADLAFFESFSASLALSRSFATPDAS